MGFGEQFGKLDESLQLEFHELYLGMGGQTSGGKFVPDIYFARELTPKEIRDFESSTGRSLRSRGREGKKFVYEVREK